MARLLKLASLSQELTPHSLRHTHTSLLAEAKVRLEEIIDRLGHCDDETTKNGYLHATKERGFPQVYATHEKPLNLGEKC